MCWKWRQVGALLQLLAALGTSAAGQALAQRLVDDHNPYTPPAIVQPFPADYFGGTAVPADPGFYDAMPNAPVDPRPEPASF